MKVGVPKECAQHERRVALIPDAVGKLVGEGITVMVEQGAGAGACFPDAVYREAGAEVVADAGALWREADVMVKVQPPTVDEVGRLRKGAALVSFLQPTRDAVAVRALAERQVTGFSMDLIPRITRAQAMDALSSQSNIAGYKAVLLAASSLGKLLPMLMTAAGTIAPAKVFVIGAGVAGLQAIATARRLGAVVSAFDVRPAVKEQVQSLGARFLEVDLADQQTEDAGGYAKELSVESHRREQELLNRTLKEVDIVITTALIPGKPAPRLITEAMVHDMKPGSVIVDLAAPAGGNCELTKPDAEVVSHGVTIHGPLDLAATVPMHASQMYARNVSSFLLALIKNGALHLDFDDEIVGATCVAHEGKVRVK